MKEGPVLVHIWIVEPADEPDLVRRLTELLDRLPAVPGFVAARVLASLDHRSVGIVVEMDSVEARQRLESTPGVTEVLHGVRGASLLKRLFHTVAERHA